MEYVISISTIKICFAAGVIQGWLLTPPAWSECCKPDGSGIGAWHYRDRCVILWWCIAVLATWYHHYEVFYSHGRVYIREKGCVFGGGAAPFCREYVWLAARVLCCGEEVALLHRQHAMTTLITSTISVCFAIHITCLWIDVRLVVCYAEDKWWECGSLAKAKDLSLCFPKDP